MAGIKFTKEETKFILENFHNTTYKILSGKTRRSQKAVKHLIRGCGIYKIDYPNGLTIDKLNEILLFKFPEKILTDNEKFILDNFATMKMKNIAEKLNIKYTQVEHIAKQVLKLPAKIPAINSSKDIEYVIKNYNKISTSLIAKYLGKTEVAVQLIANRNGLRTREFWSEDEISFLTENNKSLSDVEISKNINRTTKSITHKRIELGLEKFKFKNTNIEYFIEQLLIDLKVEYKSQFKVDRYRVDFIVDNLIIEAYGTFWHCDPRVYSTPNYIAQVNNIKNDNKKYKTLKKKGYDLLIIWEKDINEHPEKVKTDIIAAIKKSSKNGES